MSGGRPSQFGTSFQLNSAVPSVDVRADRKLWTTSPAKRLNEDGSGSAQTTFHSRSPVAVSSDIAIS
jgi:hypothetical protein